MSALEQYEPPTTPALRAVDPPSALPATAHALVEWASSARAAYTLAEMLTGTAFCPQQYRGKPAEAAAAMLAGAEVRLSPMASLRAFDNIQGTAAPKALTLRAIAQSQGHETVMVSATSQEVVMRGRRAGSSEWQSVTWTMARARQMGLADKAQWKAQPQAMLTARATSELVRLIAADAVLGIGYSAEEVADAEPGPTIAVARAVTPARRTVTRAPRPQPVEPDLDESTTPAVEAAQPDAEDDVPPQLARLSGAQHKRLHAHWRGQFGQDRDARMAYLSERTGRAITTSSELTRAEAHALLEELDAPTVEDPPEAGWGPMGGAEFEGENQ